MNKAVKCWVFAAVMMVMASCSSSEKFQMMDRQSVAGTPAPSWIWEPEYYVYKNGKFKFVTGKYRPVFGRKKYYQRSLRGYTTRGDYNAAR